MMCVCVIICCVMCVGVVQVTAEGYWQEKILGESEADGETAEELYEEQAKIAEQVKPAAHLLHVLPLLHLFACSRLPYSSFLAQQVAAYVDDGDDSVEDKIHKRRNSERAVSGALADTPQSHPLVSQSPHASRPCTCCSRLNASAGCSHIPLPLHPTPLGQREELTMMGKITAAVNPVAKVLGPIQTKLAMGVVPLRMVRYLLFWQDRIFTMWLYLALVLLTLLLALIPWGILLHYGCRLVGLAILGPRAYNRGDRSHP